MSHGRVFAYCHDSVGIGHLARTLAICDRLGRNYPFSNFLIATGTPYIPLFEGLARVDYIKLPALAKQAPDQYRSKFLPIEFNQLLDYRKAVLRDTVEHCDPEIVLVDKAPLGVCGELIPALRWLKRNRPSTRIIFGMRDIEDDAASTIQQWSKLGVPEVLEECFDEVWVYGQRDLFDVVHEYQLSAAVQAKLSFMGYVTRGACRHPKPPTVASSERGQVLVTVGGGTDGEFLLGTYLAEAAKRVSAAGYRSVVIGGPDLPPAVGRELRKQAADLANVEWLDFEPCVRCRIRDSRLVVSMGGYNTLCQIASMGANALIVPRTKPRMEQALRAQLWSERGLVHMVDPATVNAETLAEEVMQQVVSVRKSAKCDLDLNGLGRVAERFGAFWSGEVDVAAPVCV